MKKETISMDANMMFLWMRWISQLHNRNHLKIKMIPHFQRRGKKRFLMQVNKFLLLHLLILPRYWQKTYGPLAFK
ncbi:hypothetical protein Gogos_010299 [Gossypium gossypioides]|uniref:Uncharacterized protein n=1 Tax=Gossypium gossypioides TaxID=34282 RepID=A0A7J9BKU1_GOSGO|nr:hypothetical protein [Gossypium gossypioides]